MARRGHVDYQLLSKVSYLYYQDGLTQKEISIRLRISQPSVSRLLQKARRLGIVRVTCVPPSGIFTELERELESRFGLFEAIVVPVTQSDNQEVITKELGIVGAEYLLRVVRPGDVIGFSWGKTLASLALNIIPKEVSGCQVVQLIGGLGPPQSESHATDIARHVAFALNARLWLLWAPGIVKEISLKHAFLEEENNKKVFDMFSKITIAFVGIGSLSPSSIVIESGILSLEELNKLKNMGAVGDIALRFFDEYGNKVVSDIDDRVIGIDFGQLKSIKRVVGIAGGKDKIRAIKGALIGKLINVLITDNLTAEDLLNN